ncbi:MAG: histidine kinase [Flavobacteriaceae bacterium]|nr:MAG: histidine kinase [Flavobacteriaceae bacterium]
MLFSYFVGYFIIPKFFVKKQYVLATVFFILGTYFFAVFNREMILLAERIMQYPSATQESLVEVLGDFRYLLYRYIPSNFFVALIFISIKYVIGYQKIQTKDLRIAKEKSASELKALKAQLNPHFLFNTLNNIYSLSVCNSPNASIVIGKLSEILDYVLYRCNTRLVLLSNEIKLLHNYIELEKLRYDDRLEVAFVNKIQNDIEIPPLILLSLVENAFKHGAGEDSGSPKIAIEVNTKQDSFIFKISNTVSKEYISTEKKPIGLANIRKQLDLIYEKGYSLDIANTGGRFTVTLGINKSSV